MMNRKKFLLFTVMIAMLVLLFAACGDKEAAMDDPRPAPGVTEPAQTGSGAEATVVEGISISQREMEGAKDAVSAKTQELMMEEFPSTGTNEKEQTVMKMNVQIGTYTFTATLENNEAVRELVEMIQAGPVTINMSDYSGFEKVGPLGRSLTTHNSQTTTAAGDIVLYNGNNIVMFYGSNSWSYTRIGKIDDLADWTAALGSGDITAIFTLAE